MYPWCSVQHPESILRFLSVLARYSLNLDQVSFRKSGHVPDHEVGTVGRPGEWSSSSAALDHVPALQSNSCDMISIIYC